MDLKYKRDGFIKIKSIGLINHGFAIVLSPVKGFCTQKKEKPCIDTQRNEVSGFFLMDLLSIRWISETKTDGK